MEVLWLFLGMIAIIAVVCVGDAYLMDSRMPDPENPLVYQLGGRKRWFRYRGKGEQ